MVILLKCVEILFLRLFSNLVCNNFILFYLTALQQMMDNMVMHQIQVVRMYATKLRTYQQPFLHTYNNKSLWAY